MPVDSKPGRPAASLRILFSLFHAGYLRHYGEPIRLLAARGHHVHLSLGRVDKDAGDAELLAQLLEDCPTVSADLAPRHSETSGWRRIAWFVRGMGDYARYADPRYAEATALRGRIREHVRVRLEAQRLDPVTRRALWSLWRRLGATSDASFSRTWVRRFALLEEAIPPSEEATRLVADFRPDAVLASPVVEFGSAQVDVLKAAQRQRLPTAVCVSSWDNLTNKGLIRAQPDRVIVWNEVQVEELEELHGIPRERAIVTGAQRYDTWFERAPSRTRDAFLSYVGLDPQQPCLLYVCSSPFIAPSEVPFVRRWLCALRDAASPLAGAGVIVRPHPQNAEQWTDADLSEFGNVVVWPRQGRMPDSETDRADYFDSLAYSSAVVGINTSAFIEAAVVGTATYTVLDPEFAGTQEGTLHFHYIRAENGGVVHVARDLDDHLAQLARAIEDPGADAARTRAFVSRFVRPRGLDVAAAPFVAGAIEELGTLAPLHRPHRVARLLLRPPLSVAAALIGLGGRISRGSARPVPIEADARALPLGLRDGSQP